MTTSGRRLSPETRQYDDPFVGLLVVDRREENEGGGRARAEAADPHGVSPAGFRERRQGNANGEACKRQRARQPGRALIDGRDHDVEGGEREGAEVIGVEFRIDGGACLIDPS